MRSQPPGRILTARLELLPVVAEDADELAEVFLDQRMYAFTGGRPGTLEDLRATITAHIHPDHHASAAGGALT